MPLALPLAGSAHGQIHPPCTKGTTFDEKGVAFFDYGDDYFGHIGRQYNPTNIAQVASVCLGRYKAKKYPEDWKVFITQINWLRNNAVLVGDGLAGYAHHFAWYFGLQPGWLSGSAQSTAIRILIKYYRETRDDSVLPLIRRLKNLMMLPVDKGGTLATTPEGGIWIEEYPTNPPSLVLGGFLDGVYALDEFAQIFPDDVQAKTEFANAFSSLRASLKYYDSGSWIYTDRYPSEMRLPLAGDNYGIVYPPLLLGLYKITGDPLILATSLRWSSFFDNVNLGSTGSVKRDEHGIYRLVGGLPREDLEDVLKDNVSSVSAPPAIEGFGPDKLFDGNIDTYFSAVSPGPALIDVRLKHPRSVNTLRLSLYNFDLYPTQLEIQVKAARAAGFKSIPFEREVSRRNFYYHFQALRAQELRVIATRFSRQDRLVISGLALGNMNWADRATPNCNRTTPAVQIDAPGFRVSVEAPVKSAKQIFVIYRHASNPDDLESRPWEWDFIDPFDRHEIVAKEKIYQFRVLCTRGAGQRGWRGLMIVNRGNGRDSGLAYHE